MTTRTRRHRGHAAAEHGQPANEIPERPGGAELEQRVVKPVADGLAGALLHLADRAEAERGFALAVRLAR
jgi:hypothetical protein